MKLSRRHDHRNAYARQKAKITQRGVAKWLAAPIPQNAAPQAFGGTAGATADDSRPHAGIVTDLPDGGDREGHLRQRDYDPLLDAALSYEVAMDEFRRWRREGKPVPATGYFAPHGNSAQEKDSAA